MQAFFQLLERFPVTLSAMPPPMPEQSLVVQGGQVSVLEGCGTRWQPPCSWGKERRGLQPLCLARTRHRPLLPASPWEGAALL